MPKHAMTAALGPRRASEADTEEGDVPMPWWYTPRRLLVRCPLVLAQPTCREGCAPIFLLD